jgi:hypothetical protein
MAAPKDGWRPLEPPPDSVDPSEGVCIICHHKVDDLTGEHIAGISVHFACRRSLAEGNTSDGKLRN